MTLVVSSPTGTGSALLRVTPLTSKGWLQFPSDASSLTEARLCADMFTLEKTSSPPPVPILPSIDTMMDEQDVQAFEMPAQWSYPMESVTLITDATGYALDIIKPLFDHGYLRPTLTTTIKNLRNLSPLEIESLIGFPLFGRQGVLNAGMKLYKPPHLGVTSTKYLDTFTDSFYLQIEYVNIVNNTVSYDPEPVVACEFYLVGYVVQYVMSRLSLPRTEFRLEFKSVSLAEQYSLRSYGIQVNEVVQVCTSKAPGGAPGTAAVRQPICVLNGQEHGYFEHMLASLHPAILTMTSATVNHGTASIIALIDYVMREIYPCDVGKETLSSDIYNSDGSINNGFVLDLFEVAIDQQLDVDDPQLRGIEKPMIMAKIQDWLGLLMSEGVADNLRIYAIGAKVPAFYKVWTDRTMIVLFKEFYVCFDDWFPELKIMNPDQWEMVVVYMFLSNHAVEYNGTVTWTPSTPLPPFNSVMLDPPSFYTHRSRPGAGKTTGAHLTMTLLNSRFYVADEFPLSFAYCTANGKKWLWVSSNNDMLARQTENILTSDSFINMVPPPPPPPQNKGNLNWK